MDFRDVANAMRHAYLCGFNQGWAEGQRIPAEKSPDVGEDWREEMISEIFEVYREEGFVSYGDYETSDEEINSLIKGRVNELP